MSETAAVEKVEKSLEAEASSAHARINIPLNLGNWKTLGEDVQSHLLWFHQWLLDNEGDWAEAEAALGYDKSTVFRVLKGTYEGSWGNIIKAIRGFQKIVANREGIQKNEFVRNGVADLVGAGLDYALANNSVTTIIGESRMGKSVAAQWWRDQNNHGTSVLVVAPPMSGTKLFLRRIAEAVGVNKNLNTVHMYESITRAFNKNRMLIVDEAHRLLPSDRRVTPQNLEVLRDLHDTTRCGLALIATERFDEEIKRGHYQYEQIVGRIGMLKMGDVMPIVEQYLRRPSERLQELCMQIANDRGRLGILVETLKVASRIASRTKAPLNEEHVFKAVAIRKQMMGEAMFANK
jgi:DNA transposition AAA+ family ATPase